jgi:hypothetical protein
VKGEIRQILRKLIKIQLFDKRMFTLLSLKRYCSRSGVEFSQIADFSKLPIFYLPTGDTTKSAEDREVKERGSTT